MGTLIRWGQSGVNAVVKGGGPVVPGKKKKHTIGAIVPKLKAPTAPVFKGTVPDLILVQNVAMTAVDYSVYFTGGITYGLTLTPSGLVFDVNTGILSGTPDTVSGTNPILSSTNMLGSTNSNAFTITVNP